MEVTAYPNPATDIMRLNAGQHKILMVQLIDQRGNVKMVLRNTSVINLSNVMSGQYILRCQTDKGIVSKNIVVIH
jgi:hypothetical protein